MMRKKYALHNVEELFDNFVVLFCYIDGCY